MNLKVGMLSELHLGNHKDFSSIDSDGFNTRMLLQIEALSKIFTKFSENEVTHVFFLGDTFNKRGLIEPEVFNKFMDLLLLYDFEYLFLTGNHDITSENEYFSTVNMIKHPGVDVIYKPTFLSKGKNNYLFVPHTSLNFKNVVDRLLKDNNLNKKSVVLFMHQDVSPYVESKNSVNVEYLYGFKHVFCGHIHSFIENRNITIIGTPYPVTYSDSNDNYVLVSDYDDIKNYKKINVNKFHPRFITVDDVSKVKDEYNFYRIETDNLNTKSSGNVKLKFRRKQIIIQNSLTNFSYKNVIKHYCKKVDNVEMQKYGVEFYDRANES